MCRGEALKAPAGPVQQQKRCGPCCRKYGEDSGMQTVSSALRMSSSSAVKGGNARGHLRRDEGTR